MDLFAAPAATGFPPPRECQTKALNLLREGIRAGRRRQVLVMPTGGGKTMTALHLINEALKKGKRALFVCDRIALINQTSARADEYGIPHGVIQAGHWRRDNSQPFQIASVQTLAARQYWHESDVMIVDECHSMHTAWVEAAKNSGVVVVGLTATPFTKGLGNVFDGAVNAATMHELTEAGVLVPMRILTCVTPDMAGAETAGGEWTAKAASERELQIVGDVVSEWQKHADNRKTIAFGASIAYCTELVAKFNEAGILAAAYTSETDDQERAALLAEFSKPDSAIRVLVSVAALSKGFDVQDIGCVIDARPLRKSLSEVIQMWGRGLRSSPETGKTECLLLDHSGNARRFHDDFVDVYFNGCGDLDTAEKKDAVIRKEEPEFDPAGCPQCKHKPFHKRCLACGFEKVAQAEVDAVPGVMKEIHIGKRKAAESKRDLWNQLCTHARFNTGIKKPAGFAYHKYVAITGEKPVWSYDDAPVVPITPALEGKLRSMRIAYIKGRQFREARI